MRGFLFLLCVAAANADKLGYNYQPLGHDIEIGGALLGGGIVNAGHAAAFGFDVGGAGGGIASTADAGFGRFTGAHDVAAGNFDRGNNVGAIVGPTATNTEYNKEFYTYTAPEEEFDDIAAAQQFSNSLKRNLRVVFIRAPENQGLANAALQLAQQSAADRTAIYVLSKQTDIGDLANKLQTLNTDQTHRPEVHFVKYRTPEEATRAQQTIQAQYDALGGPTFSSNEGVAPVLNFASSPARSVNDGAGGAAALGGLSGEQVTGGVAALTASLAGFATAAQNGYLPPALNLN